MVGRVVPLTTSEQTLGDAAAAFLSQPSLARSTRRSYDQTLTRLVRELDSDRPLSTLPVAAVTVAVTAGAASVSAAASGPAAGGRADRRRARPAAAPRAGDSAGR